MKTVNTFKNLLLVALVIALASCEEAIDPNLVKVTAEVKYEDNNDNKTSVTGAIVKVYESGTQYRSPLAETTTKLGKFSFQLPVGTYDFTVSKEGSTNDFPPPGFTSRTQVKIPESSLGNEYELKEFIYQ